MLLGAWQLCVLILLDLIHHMCRDPHGGELHPTSQMPLEP